MAAERGWHLQLASRFTYRTYRERWIDALAESLRAYETMCARHGRDGKAAERMLLIPFFVHEDRAKAREIFARHVIPRV